LLSNTISTLPIDVFRGDEEIPAPPLLVSPAAGWTLEAWLWAIMQSLLLRGNAYGLITARSGPRLTPAQVEPVNPDNMSVNVDVDGSITYRFKGRVLDPSDVWHVAAFRPAGSPVGLSPISAASETIGLGLAVQRFGRAFFADGAMPSGLLAVEQKMSQSDIDLARARLDRATHGRRQPLIVSGGGAGDVKWTNLSIAPEESQFVESRKLGVSEIARTFGVPPEMIGGEAGNSLTYATVEGRAVEFVKFSLSHWLVRLERAIGDLLPRGQSVKFNVNALLRGTTKERYEAHEIALRNRWLTVDEVRELEDRGPLPAGASSPPSLQAVEGTGS
jgi:HK97 family phage portal protein